MVSEKAQEAVEAGREYSAPVEDMALPAGHGVARLGGLVVFVPGGVTGDRVRIRIARAERRFAYGEVVAIEEASPLRQAPACAHFGACGGCDLQMLGYEAQLRLKENHLVQTLARIGGQDIGAIKVSPIVPSVGTFFYRGKMELSFGNAGGRLCAGLAGRSSLFSPHAGQIVPIEECLLFSPVAGRLLPIVMEALLGAGLAAYDERTGAGALKRLVLREAKGTNEVMLHIIAASDVSRALAPLKAALAASLPQVVSVYATSGGATTRLLWGAPAIEERLSCLSFHIYPRTFFQPNPMTAALLYERLAGLPGVGQARSVLGLYCGAGPIEIFLARLAPRASVTGVDSSGENIASAKENAALNGIGNCRFIKDRAERAARIAAGKTDLLVIDPPRRGMGAEALAAVLRIRPEKIAYVSCNPSTLARDLKDLGRTYRAKEVVPFDFFPHTAHFEALALLERA
jgi:23S rRNA (uracil1939-C5)-methyltransferase